MARMLPVLVTVLLCCGTAWSQIIVNETFDAYANAAAFSQTWVPYMGDGVTTTGGPIGILTPCVPGDPCPPLAPYDGTGDAAAVPPVAPLANQAAVYSNLGGSINEWDTDNTPGTVPFSLLPSTTQNVRYTADIFDDGGVYAQSSFGRRFSVGLRNDTIDREPGTFGLQAGLNLVELGMWNATAIDPTDGVTMIPSTQLAYRVVLFGQPGPPLIQNPNWQYFTLPIEFDDPLIDHNGDGKLGDGNGTVNHADIGPGWHRYAAEISTTGITLTLDLFRDGTVDSTVDWDILMAADPANPGVIAPFTSLRMGGPSGVSMNEFTMVDNVRLELVDVMTGIDGDFDNDGDYDCGDVNSLSTAVATGGSVAMFDLNGDGSLSLADVDAWRAEAGENNLGPGRVYTIADANLDGFTDGSDFGAWNSSKFTTNTAYCNGNFNADGVTDGSDFGLWNANKFTSAAAAVPEPVSPGAWMIAGLAWIVRRIRYAAR